MATIRSGWNCGLNKGQQTSSAEVRPLDNQTKNTAGSKKKDNNSLENIITVADDKSFDKILNETKFECVVICFGRESTDSFQLMEPIVVAQARENTDSVLFLKVTVELCPKTVRFYDIEPVPEFVFRKRKFEVHRCMSTDAEPFRFFVTENQRTYPVAKNKLIGLYFDDDEKFKDWLDGINAMRKWDVMLLVIYFVTNWCIRYNSTASFIQEMITVNFNVQFIEVNAEKCPAAASQYEIRVLPTFVFHKYNTVVDMIESYNEIEIKNTITLINERNVAIVVTDDENFKFRLDNAGDLPVIVCLSKKTSFAFNLEIQQFARHYEDMLFLIVYKQKCPKTTKYYGIHKTSKFVLEKRGRERRTLESDDIVKWKEFIDQNNDV